MHLKPSLHTILMIMMPTWKIRNLLSSLWIFLAHGTWLILQLIGLLLSDHHSLKLLNLLLLSWGRSILLLLSLPQELLEETVVHPSEVPEHHWHTHLWGEGVLSSEEVEIHLLAVTERLLEKWVVRHAVLRVAEKLIVGEVVVVSGEEWIVGEVVVVVSVVGSGEEWVVAKHAWEKVVLLLLSLKLLLLLLLTLLLLLLLLLWLRERLLLLLDNLSLDVLSLAGSVGCDGGDVDFTIWHGSSNGSGGEWIITEVRILIIVIILILVLLILLLLAIHHHHHVVHVSTTHLHWLKHSSHSPETTKHVIHVIHLLWLLLLWLLLWLLFMLGIEIPWVCVFPLVILPKNLTDIPTVSTEFLNPIEHPIELFLTNKTPKLVFFV